GGAVNSGVRAPASRSPGSEPAKSGPGPAASTRELEHLTAVIQALPERSRQVLTLRKIYGLSQREIAVRLGIEERAVEAHLADGMRRCIELLGVRSP
ncbi:MAG: sigma-70 family RNA polymerase sigma factor, partial [Opitutaceae bacterium]|nr:sigma-70 family RNA polymerase sigma factor [Opitutaceae bacterium]